MMIGYALLIFFMMAVFEPLLAIPAIVLVLIGIVDQWLDTADTWTYTLSDLK